jgi:hypothetical protein
MAEHCSWLLRWLHRRKRDADRAFMLPMLIGAARRGFTDHEWLNREPSQCERALAAFHLFTEQPGQEHWLCACATTERTELEELLKEVDPDVDNQAHHGELRQNQD